MIKMPIMKTKFLYVILCLTFLLWGSQLLAQTITVTNNNNSGAGSLRKALSDAKTSAINPITIKFSAAVTTITISNHLPINRNLTRSIIIDGEGRVTLKGTGTRVIDCWLLHVQGQQHL